MDKDLKRTGYILLFIGLLMIFGSLLQLIFVFTGMIDPIKLFQFSSSDFAIEGDVLFPQLPSSLTKDLKVEIFPAEFINSVLNLGANSALMGLIIFAGGKVASIAAQLLRPVYIKSKTSE